MEPWTALDLSWDRTASTETHGAFPVYGISQRWESLGGNDWTPPWFSAPWFTDDVNSLDSADRLYAKMRLLAGKDVRMIVSVNPSKIVMLAEQLRDRSDELIDDIRGGALLGRPHPAVSPDRELAARLSVLRGRERRPLRLTDVFARLDLVVCWMSGSARFYEAWMRDLIPDVAILPFSTTGTEGIVTLPIDGHTTAGPLATNQGLYEFFSIDDEGETTGESVPMEHLERGGQYRLVMSQANGLYRYDVGDNYRVVGHVGGTPRLEFQGRAGVRSSFTGEKLTDSDLHTTVARTTSGCGRLPFFTAIPVWGTPPRYVVAMESSEVLDAKSLIDLAPRLDAVLQEVNIEYGEKRKSQRLSSIEVVPLRSGAFKELTEYRLAQGAAPAQIKHHWLQSDSAVLSILNEIGVVSAGTLVGRS
ncbi:GH3 auxin-responsive promoter OS=Tsukamurella paurometabola (strain ATCC 8368 / DSM / CCUG 35730/ CIP 100753 / JCM 10117 / KCTC 9821 / NBRC 16120 / NCIMB 702349 / NCTC 13040) OX=521096 GN=Tpau_2698 PE=4 SV=1 [Tsukamurella paurometabola]|uniref:GH3 auxin-responsive promoter n=1 Tax=Tsukamurella paurometabola (strain ATCC 8368 / DSM 20162 / CCUG 35730 / CIP 100753 / JCM 10117 / KCTC 9821 / NBRC 16120 / NCIMB 702349 / NCTC 13040) TaxID=521096 RepID=D5USM6_TSUPD|nr:GH3 auxin-responsive promoter family protein [Tsukamurella paurometabola]ADG79297.1 GH3 auxin-responsive promoter [Tsukamurella paurometabola DSM 20162]SUP34966.1 GH3 auxin-responsive promoter [Tsukamurella paurometabola]